MFDGLWWVALIRLNSGLATRQPLALLVFCDSLEFFKQTFLGRRFCSFQSVEGE